MLSSTDGQPVVCCCRVLAAEPEIYCYCAQLFPVTCAPSPIYLSDFHLPIQAHRSKKHYDILHGLAHADEQGSLKKKRAASKTTPKRNNGRARRRREKESRTWPWKKELRGRSRRTARSAGDWAASGEAVTWAESRLNHVTCLGHVGCDRMCHVDGHVSVMWNEQVTWQNTNFTSRCFRVTAPAFHHVTSVPRDRPKP